MGTGGVEDWVLGGRGWGAGALMPWGAGALGRTGRMDVRSFGRSDGRTEIPPVFYRTSSPSGLLPKNGKIDNQNRKKIEK